MSTLVLIILIVAIVLIVFSIAKSGNKKNIPEKNSRPKPSITSGKSYSKERASEFDQPFDKAAPENSEAYHIMMAIGTDGKPADYKAPASDLDNWPLPVAMAYFLFNMRGELVKVRDVLIRTEYPLSDQVLKEYGILKQDLEANSIPASEAYQQLVADTVTCRNLIAHNVSYVNKVLNADFIRNKIKYPFRNIKNTCTMRETKDYVMIPSDYSDDYKLPKLEELIGACFHVPWDPEGFRLEDVQSAKWKARATAKCFLYLKKTDEI